MKEYIPKIYDTPRTVNLPTAWGNIPTILKDIITRFNIKTNLALEFGVEKGFSTSAIANYFDSVIGVDSFDWYPDGNIEAVKEILKDYPNILLIKSKYQDFILNNRGIYDLIHVDIGYETHDYETTYPCGEWSVQHSDCVIFHDTLTFPGVH